MTDLVRDSLREGLKAKGRFRRQSAVRRAEAANGNRQIRNDLLPALKLESYLIDALGSHSRRLRKPDAAHIREIATSIGALGFNAPLLIGRDNRVIDGESRLAAARKLGLASVPCIRVDHLNESEQRLLRLAVNRLGENGSWDIAELEAEFKELIIAEAPIELSGFGSDEIDQILIGSEDENAEVGDPEPGAGASSVSRINDLGEESKFPLSDVDHLRINFVNAHFPAGFARCRRPGHRQSACGKIILSGRAG